MPNISALARRLRPDAPAAPGDPSGEELLLFGRRRGFFGETNLLRLVTVVTLLLQFISFMTTLQGADVFLGGLFPLAPLCFAVAVQAAAWFLAGSLRARITFLRSVALGLALCCSTYYSYVGIYNSVEPPAVYLAAEYAKASSELNDLFDSSRAAAFRTAEDQVNGLAGDLAARLSLLEQESERLAACEEELDGVSAGYTDGLRAPSRSAYADYEDYLAAYNAYLAAVTASAPAEQAAARAEILGRYGFASEAGLAEARAKNAADLAAIEAAAAALDGGEGTAAEKLERARAGLLADLAGAKNSGELDAEARSALARLVQLAAAQTGSALTTEALLAPLEQAMAGVGEPLLTPFDQLAATLEGGAVTRANAQEMKTLLSAEIAGAVLRVNEATGGDWSADDEAWRLTDLHLAPLLALARPADRGMALFCLFLAALMDGLTLLFSVSCRRPRTLLGARSPRRLLAQNGQVLAAQMAVCLPESAPGLAGLRAFLDRFAASPATLAEGFDLAADRAGLGEYERLCALLCQAGLAAIRPAEDGRGETVLLRADFLLFANELLACRRQDQLEGERAAEAAARRAARAVGQAV